MDLPHTEGRYGWARENTETVFDSTVVAVKTDAGITGHGEYSPLRPDYLPAYAAGIRAALAQLAPKLPGADPTHRGVQNLWMEAAMRGHPHVKASTGMACWGILGKATDWPVYALLGGAEQRAALLYRAISQDGPEVMAHRVTRYRADGYTEFQFEQPCRTFPECLSVRRRTALLFVQNHSRHQCVVARPGRRCHGRREPVGLQGWGPDEVLEDARFVRRHRHLPDHRRYPGRGHCHGSDRTLEPLRAPRVVMCRARRSSDCTDVPKSGERVGGPEGPSVTPRGICGSASRGRKHFGHP
jgi:hypothetical protein